MEYYQSLNPRAIITPLNAIVDYGKYDVVVVVDAAWEAEVRPLIFILICSK